MFRTLSAIFSGASSLLQPRRQVEQRMAAVSLGRMISWSAISLTRTRQSPAFPGDLQNAVEEFVDVLPARTGRGGVRDFEHRRNFTRRVTPSWVRIPWPESPPLQLTGQTPVEVRKSAPAFIDGREGHARGPVGPGWQQTAGYFGLGAHIDGLKDHVHRGQRSIARRVPELDEGVLADCSFSALLPSYSVPANAPGRGRAGVRSPPGSRPMMGGQ